MYSLFLHASILVPVQDIDYLTPNRVEYATNHRDDLWEIACEKGTLDICSDDECEVMSSEEEDFFQEEDLQQF